MTYGYEGFDGYTFGLTYCGVAAAYFFDLGGEGLVTSASNPSSSYEYSSSSSSATGPDTGSEYWSSPESSSGYGIAFTRLFLLVFELKLMGL